MTTVVFDGYVLAADKRGTGIGTERRCEHCKEISKIFKDDFNKIVVPKHEITYKGEKLLALGMAGNSSFIEAISKLIHLFTDFKAMIDCCVYLHGFEGQSIMAICEDTAFIIRPLKKSLRKPGKFVLDIDSVKYKKDLNNDGIMYIGSGGPYVKMGRDLLKISATELIQLVSKYDSGTSPTYDSYIVRPYPEEPITKEIVSKVEKVIEKKVKTKPTTKRNKVK